MHPCQAKREIKLKITHSLLFSPVPSPRFPLGKHNCSFIASAGLGEATHRGWGRFIFGGLTLQHHPKPSTQPGPQGCYCCRNLQGKVGMERVLTPWKKEKETWNKIELRLQSTAELPAQQNVHKHILWPGLFMCCQGDKGNSCWLGRGRAGTRTAGQGTAATLLPPALGDTALGTASHHPCSRWAMEKAQRAEPCLEFLCEGK